MQAGDRRLEGVPGVLAAPGEALDQHEAERVDVDRGRHRLPAHLLGAEVGRGADDHARGRHRRGVADRGDAEVGQVGAAVTVEQDVAGLDVAVHDPAPVDVAEGVGQGGAERDHVAERQRAAADPLGEGVALDELHDEVGAPVVVADVVDRDQPGVRERRERQDLAAVAGVGALLEVADQLGGRARTAAAWCRCPRARSGGRTRRPGPGRRAVVLVLVLRRVGRLRGGVLRPAATASASAFAAATTSPPAPNILIATSRPRSSSRAR